MNASTTCYFFSWEFKVVGPWSTSMNCKVVERRKVVKRTLVISNFVRAPRRMKTKGREKKKGKE